MAVVRAAHRFLLTWWDGLKVGFGVLVDGGLLMLACGLLLGWAIWHP